MSESLNHWLNWFVQRQWTIQERNKQLSVWVSHWITDSTDSFNSTESFRNETSNCLWVSRWIIDLTDLFKENDPFRNETSNCQYEWVIESLTQLIRSTALNHLGMKQATVYEWVIESLAQLIRSTALNHLGMKQATVYEWVIESLTQLIRSTALNHLGMKQATVYEWVIESLAQLIRSTALNRLGMKQATVCEWVVESLTQLICSKTMNHSGTKHHCCCNDLLSSKTKVNSSILLNINLLLLFHIKHWIYMQSISHASDLHRAIFILTTIKHNLIREIKCKYIILSFSTNNKVENISPPENHPIYYRKQYGFLWKTQWNNWMYVYVAVIECVWKCSCSKHTSLLRSYQRSAPGTLSCVFVSRAVCLCFWKL